MIYLTKVPEPMKPHIVKIFDGEYDIPMKFNGSPNIVDIGANIGAFTVWAAERWKGKVIAIEPNKSNFEILQINTAFLGDRVGLMNAAVRADKSNTKLYDGKNNCGECSFFKGEEQADTFTEVNVITPLELPHNIDILKIDTEGCEIEILLELLKLKVHPKAILVEYHTEKDRRVIDDILEPFYNMWASIAQMPGFGVVKYVLNSIEY
jgi:FkbM family methyltransferase